MSAEGEEKLQQKLLSLTQNDFYIFQQTKGKNLVHSVTVIIDLLLYPKQHLIDAGFDPVWFGIEVKHFGQPGETGKMSRFIWQCITYVQSEFETKDHSTIRPTFILGFSDINEVNGTSETERYYLAQWLGMVRLAGLAKVGIFNEIKPSNHYPTGGWKIEFSSSTYFRVLGSEYHRTNYDIHKINVGNCAN